MAINERAGNSSNDAISTVANYVGVDLSATIKPQNEIDLSKGGVDFKQHADAVGSALQETAAKVEDLGKIEQALHGQLADAPAGGGDAGLGRSGGLSRGMAIGLMGALGLVSPAAAAGMGMIEAVRFAATPVQAPGIHTHAAERPIGSGPSDFKSPVGRSGKADQQLSVYEDALGGQWNSQTGFAVPVATQPPPASVMQRDRDINAAAGVVVGKLGADAVSKDLGQVGEAKKRLGQQGQEALDEADRIYGVTPDAKLDVVPPKPGAPGGPRFGGFFG